MPKEVMPKRKTTYWRTIASGMATVHMVGKPQSHLTIRRAKDWVTIYHKGKKIWHCNAIFFRKHFCKET